jgi:Fe2+ or Zn2+ uptake regulation protein
VGDLRTALLSAKLVPNKSTLYRELYFLMEQKVVTEVDFLDGMKRYEFIAHDGHHHHIICTKCKAAECVEVCFDTSALLADLAKHSDFLVQNHVLEFFGLCGRCK